MLSIAHAPTGALIATKIPNPIISLPLVLLSHYLEDRVPHWDVGVGMNKGPERKRTAFFQELLIDGPLSVLLVYFFFQYGHTEFVWRAWLGWFIGLLPDFLEFPINFLGIKVYPLNKLSGLHHWFHRSTTNKFWGLLPQFIVILIVYSLR